MFPRAKTPDVNRAIAIYSLEPVRRDAADASGDAADSNLLTINVGRRAELGLPYAMADDDTFVERQAEDSGEVWRHRGYRQDCRLAVYL